MELKDFTDEYTQIALARAIGFAPSFVNQWVKGVRPVPPAACLAIERATNGKVKRQDLRPSDFWLIWPDLEHLAPSTPKCQGDTQIRQGISVQDLAQAQQGGARA